MRSTSTLLKYTLFYAIGVLFAYNLLLPISTLTITLLCFFTLSLTLHKINRRKRNYLINIFLLLSYLLLFLTLGSWRATLSPYIGGEYQSQISNRASEAPLQLLIEKRGVSRTGKSVVLTAYSKKYRERVILYITDNQLKEKIKPGSIVTIKSVLKPFELSHYVTSGYLKWLKRRGCFNWGYLNRKDIIEIGFNRYSIYALSNMLKEPFINKIIESSKGEAWGATLIALTTGERDYLERGVMDSFRNSGTVHLMSVSGLHIGFVYLIVIRITSLFGRGERLKRVRALMVIVAVWVYSLMCGLSISSIRASSMITVLALSKLISSEYNTINALAVSALITLLFNPLELLNLGFQLSYCAILSTLFITPYFSKVLAVKNRFFNAPLKLIAVTLSIQIGLSIITILNFGEIPLYSLLANLVVIPLASILIPFAIATFTLSLFLSIPTIVIKFLMHGVEFLQLFVERVEQLPNSVIVMEHNSIEQYFVVAFLILTIIYTSIKGSLHTN